MAFGKAEAAVYFKYKTVNSFQFLGKQATFIFTADSHFLLTPKTFHIEYKRILLLKQAELPSAT